MISRPLLTTSARSKTLHRSLTLLLFFVLTSLLTACVSTELTSVWVGQENSKSYSRLLVVGISKNGHDRRIHEDALVSVLSKNGVGAIPSYTVLNSAIDHDLDTILENLPETDADALLITHVLGVEKVSIMHPPSLHVIPRRYYDYHYSYYWTSFDYVHTPGYTSNHVIVRQETNLYDRVSTRLLWSGQTRTVDPQSTKILSSDLAKRVSKALRQTSLISN